MANTERARKKNQKEREKARVISGEEKAKLTKKRKREKIEKEGGEER